MENRFRVHYHGNTVIPPAPGKKRKDKSMRRQRDYTHTGKIMTRADKVCATTRCVWCDVSFGDQYRTICHVCTNCQYCGLASTSSLTVCPNCGNRPDDEIAPPRVVLRPTSTE